MTASVRGLAITPVKGTRLRAVERLQLDRNGAAEDRRFYVVDARGQMVNGKRLGGLTEVVAEILDPDGLRLSFPDGRVVEAPVREGETLTTRFYSRSCADPVLEGPFADALSSHLGEPVRLVRATGPAGAVDRGAKGAVSLVSEASLREFAAQGEIPSVDARRFRMLVEIDGVPPHAEDRWVGTQVWIGSALVALRGHVGRCLITSRHPDTGEVDLPTLDVLRSYRAEEVSTEPLPFGVYGEVVAAGAVRVGDEVRLAEDVTDPPSH